MIDRSLDYTLVIGDDMKDSLCYIKDEGGAPMVYYNHEIFYFDPRFNEEEVMKIYDNREHTADNHVMFILGGIFNYTREEIVRMNKIYNMCTIGSAFPSMELYRMIWSYDQRTNMGMPFVPEKHTFAKSGYVGSTKGNNNIYNLIDFIDGVSYVITIVTNNFIGKDLSNSIRTVFRDYMIANGKPNFDHPDVPKLPRLFGKRRYDELRDILRATDKLFIKNRKPCYREALKNDPVFIKAFSELTDKNIIINFHVLARDFI